MTLVSSYELLLCSNSSAQFLEMRVRTRIHWRVSYSGKVCPLPELDSVLLIFMTNPYQLIVGKGQTVQDHLIASGEIPRI